MIQFYTPLVTAHMQASILMLIPVPCLSSDSMTAEWETWAISIPTDRKLELFMKYLWGKVARVWFQPVVPNTVKLCTTLFSSESE